MIGFKKKMNIILTGFMGTGKSSVGRLIADRTGRVYHDTDETIERQERMTISEIFTKHGENCFREKENELVRSLIKIKDAVIATGGGMVLNSENRRILKSIGKVFCLKASPKTIYRRIAKQQHRPLLHNSMTIGRINDILEERREIYADCDYKIDTDNLTIEQTADRIIELMKNEN